MKANSGIIKYGNKILFLPEAVGQASGKKSILFRIRLFKLRALILGVKKIGVV